MRLDPTALPVSAYEALQRFSESECAKEAKEVARRAALSTENLRGGALPFRVSWVPSVEMLYLDNAPIHKVDRRNARDATPPLGEQVPRGARVVAIVILRQEVSSQDQSALTDTGELPFAVAASAGGLRLHSRDEVTLQQSLRAAEEHERQAVANARTAGAKGAQTASAAGIPKAANGSRRCCISCM